ncbi:MAG: LamG domain-containing protein, partial [Bacteroidia bacterium]
MKKTLCTIAAAFLLLGSVKQATAQTGQALNFSSGGNNYAITSTNIAHGNHFTYEAWVNIITPSDWAGIMTTNTQTGQAQWVQFSINSAGNLRCEIVDDANNNKTYDGTTVLTGSWHHVAITFDGTSLLFYVDGNVETTTIFQDATLGTMTVNSLLNVGAERSLGSQINGTIDAARVWNVTRTQAQIQSTMHIELTSAQ